MEQQRDVILCAERSLLHTLGFHFHAEHPYKHLLRIVKQMSEEKVIPEKNARDLAQVAWNFANDSLRTLLCLQYTSLEVAHSVLFLGNTTIFLTTSQFTLHFSLLSFEIFKCKNFCREGMVGNMYCTPKCS